MRWALLRALALIACLSVSITPVHAADEEALSRPSGAEPRSTGTPAESQSETPKTPTSLWHYGGFMDLAYALDFNFPGNHLWRDLSTTPKMNDSVVNMGTAYVRKGATIESQWGTELLMQAGQDSNMKEPSPGTWSQHDGGLLRTEPIAHS